MTSSLLFKLLLIPGFALACAVSMSAAGGKPVQLAPADKKLVAQDQRGDRDDGKVAQKAKRKESGGQTDADKTAKKKEGDRRADRTDSDGRSDRRTPTDAAKVTTRKNSGARLSEEQQEAALAFATKNHPELARLLNQLRQRSPTAFARGIREVHFASQRIQRMAERSPNRVDAELRRWKTDSEIRLLTARWAMSQDPALEKKIRSSLRERQEARLDDMKSERDRLAARLRQLDQQIGMGTAELEQSLEDEFNRLSRQALTAARQQKSKRNDDRSAQQDKADSSESAKN